MMINKRIKIISYILCALSFVAQGIFAYSFGNTTYSVKFNSTLLSLSEEEKNNGYEFTRLTFLDDNNSFTFKKASNLLAINYSSYKVFSHYLVAGSRINLGESTIKVTCDELDSDAEILKVNGYNDLDYMYEIPLPLYRYNKDENGNPVLWPTYDSRPMNVSYGANYSTYVSSDFADELIDRNPNLYHSYNDLIGVIYNLSIVNETSSENVTCSINNIYLSSQSERWDIETKDMYLSRYNNFPVDFGTIHKNGIFFVSNDFFLKYGFWYEADIQTTYSNYKFYLENIAENTIKENSLKTYFDIPDFDANGGHKWENYNNISGILLGEYSRNYLLLSFSIVFSIMFLLMYFWCCDISFNNQYVLFRYKKSFFAAPIAIFAAFQLLISTMLLFARSKYYFFNNYIGNIWMLLSIFAAVIIYLLVKNKYVKGR